MAENDEELKTLLMRVKEESDKAGLKLNFQKTKITASRPITSWQIEGVKVETMINLFSWAPKSLWTDFRGTSWQWMKIFKWVPRTGTLDYLRTLVCSHGLLSLETGDWAQGNWECFLGQVCVLSAAKPDQGPVCRASAVPRGGTTLPPSPMNSSSVPRVWLSGSIQSVWPCLVDMKDI